MKEILLVIVDLKKGNFFLRPKITGDIFALVNTSLGGCISA